MDYAPLMAAVAVLGAFGLGGGWIFRLSSRLSQADAKADAAALLAAAVEKTSAEKTASLMMTCAQLRLSLEQNETALVEHRVNVAKEYVSTATIAALEEKLIKAIDRLGDRLDNLFTARPGVSNA